MHVLVGTEPRWSVRAWRMGGWRPDSPAAARGSTPPARVSHTASTRLSAWHAALQPLRDAAQRGAQPSSADAALALASEALRRIQEVGGADAASTELCADALASDLCLLCAALVCPTDAPTHALPAPLALWVRQLGDLCCARGSAFPAAAVPACARFLASALARPRHDAAAPTDALRALSALLQDCGSSVPPSDLPGLCDALLPWAVPPAAGGAPEGVQGTATATASPPLPATRREPAMHALSALASLCGRAASGACSSALSERVLCAVDAALRLEAGPPAATPAAPLPPRAPDESPSATRFFAAALRCAHVCAPEQPKAASTPAGGSSAAPSAAAFQVALSQPLICSLLAQARRFMVFGISRESGATSPQQPQPCDDSDSDAESVTCASGERQGGAWRVRCGACLLVSALARAGPRTVQPHWPALLAPRPGGPNGAKASLPALCARDSSPRVRAAAGGALAGLLEGPSARTYLHVAESAKPSLSAASRAQHAAQLSALLADAAVATHAALVEALACEDVLAALVAACKAASALLLAAPFARLPQHLLPAVARACAVRASALRASRAPDAPAAHLAMLATLTAALSTRAASPALASAMEIRQDVCDGAAGFALSSLLSDLASLAAEESRAPPLRCEALAALRGAGRNYPPAFAGCWAGVYAALRCCVSSPDDKVATAAGRCLCDALRAAGGAEPDSSGNDVTEEGIGGALCTAAATLPAIDSHLLAQMWIHAATALLPALAQHSSSAVRAVGCGAPSGLTSAVVPLLPPPVVASLLALPVNALQCDAAASVRASGARALGSTVSLPQLRSDPGLFEHLQAVATLLARAVFDAAPAVALAAAVACANLCGALREEGGFNVLSETHAAALARAAVTLTRPPGADKLRSHGARALGHLCWRAAVSGASPPDWRPHALHALLCCLSPQELAASPKTALGAVVALDSVLRSASGADAAAAQATLHAICPCTRRDRPIRMRCLAAQAMRSPATRGSYGGAWGVCVRACASALTDAEHSGQEDDRAAQQLRGSLTATLLHALSLWEGGEDAAVMRDSAAMISPPVVAALEACAAATAHERWQSGAQECGLLPEDPFGVDALRSAMPRRSADGWASADESLRRFGSPPLAFRAESAQAAARALLRATGEAAMDAQALRRALERSES